MQPQAAAYAQDPGTDICQVLWKLKSPWYVASLEISSIRTENYTMQKHSIICFLFRFLTSNHGGKL